MVFEFEAFGREVRQVAGALFDLVHPAAGAAVEVVMVTLAGDLEAGRLAGHLDLDNSAVGDEGLQRAIDRGHPHPADAALGEIEDFAGGYGAVSFCDDRADCVPLLGVSFHLGHA